MEFAFLLGILLSTILIGPVFFLLIETSLTKGWRAAIFLDLGVITADILCILMAYYGSKDLANIIQTHPSLYIIGGFIVFVYGVFMFFSKPQLHIENSTAVVSSNYIKTFINGFLLNLLNLGVVVFWFLVVSSVAISYPKWDEFMSYMGIILLTYFTIDIGKIFLARKVKKRLTDERVFMIRKIIGISLIVFGIIITLKGFGFFSDIDRQIEERIVPINTRPK